MEQKKLLRILRRDMSELEELISELKENQADNIPEIRFLHTRTQGVLELVEILYQSFTPLSTNNNMEHKEVEDVKPLTYISEPIDDDVKISDDHEAIDNEIEVEDNIEVAQDEINKVEMDSEVVDKIDETNEVQEHQPITSSDDQQKEHKVSLGETFIHRDTLNEKVSGNASISDKFNKSKINSLQSAIGMNDKFLYIRELFDGDANKFQSTISTLDSKNDLKEAVNYLSENFQWKKTDTSINFINLLKRRFL